MIDRKLRIPRTLDEAIVRLSLRERRSIQAQYLHLLEAQLATQGEALDTPAEPTTDRRRRRTRGGTNGS